MSVCITSYFCYLFICLSDCLFIYFLGGAVLAVNQGWQIRNANSRDHRILDYSRKVELFRGNAQRHGELWLCKPTALERWGYSTTHYPLSQHAMAVIHQINNQNRTVPWHEPSSLANELYLTSPAKCLVQERLVSLWIPCKKAFCLGLTRQSAERPHACANSCLNHWKPV